MGSTKKSKITKSMKKSFSTQKVNVTNITDKCRRGLVTICNIEKGDFVTFYGTIPFINKEGANNSMCIFTEKKIYAGDPSDKNKLTLGQFANDNAFDIEMIKLIKSGDVNDAFQMYRENSHKNNNVELSANKTPSLVASKDIQAGDIIYTQFGLSYWILKHLNEFRSHPNLLSRINTYTLKVIKEKNNNAVLYDKEATYSYNYDVKESINKTTGKKKPVLVYDNEEMSEGMALIILARLYKLNQIYFSMTNLPIWIYESPYKVLLYLNLVIGVIPKNIDNLIFQTMTKKEYTRGYKLYCELEEAKLCKEFVTEEDFIYYYRHWKDLFYILHKNNINLNDNQ